VPVWSLEYLMGRWRSTIGDPTFIGWFTVGSYFACAILSFILVSIDKGADRRLFHFWGMVGLLMILLGINKQLDLQSLLTEVGRQVARAQGWMDQRRTVPFWFIVAFGNTALGGFLSFAVIRRVLFRRFMITFTGLFLILSFIVVRAATFHDFDEMLGFELFEARMNWVR